jgi:hypothetical protein
MGQTYGKQDCTKPSISAWILYSLNVNGKYFSRKKGIYFSRNAANYFPEFAAFYFPEFMLFYIKPAGV